VRFCTGRPYTLVLSTPALDTPCIPRPSPPRPRLCSVDLIRQIRYSLDIVYNGCVPEWLGSPLVSCGTGHGCRSFYRTHSPSMWVVSLCRRLYYLTLYPSNTHCEGPASRHLAQVRSSAAVYCPSTHAGSPNRQHSSSLIGSTGSCLSWIAYVWATSFMPYMTIMLVDRLDKTGAACLTLPPNTPNPGRRSAEWPCLSADAARVAGWVGSKWDHAVLIGGPS